MRVDVEAEDAFGVGYRRATAAGVNGNGLSYRARVADGAQGTL